MKTQFGLYGNQKFNNIILRNPEIFSNIEWRKRKKRKNWGHKISHGMAGKDTLPN